MDRTALVTGASSGIGRAVSSALAEGGYGVALAARGADELERLPAEIGEERTLAVPTDVVDPAEWAVRSFTHSVLAETRDDDVRAHAISPGIVATPMAGRAEDDPELISVDDVVATVRWLLGLRPFVQVRDAVLERTLA